MLKQLPQTVAEWLAYIEALHPKSIEMGLDRVSQVAERLLLNLNCPVITVAGTNGKGSTCAMLSQLYLEAGYKIGCYTSPHLVHYHERININQIPIADDSLCTAFLAVETARGEIPLTYFEMGTLVALWYFMQHDLDVVILEVGLGGRLDAVNIIDADCAIVTNVDLDHMEYLGNTRDEIGLEKAGVYRTNQISICGDTNPPFSLLTYGKRISADIKVLQRDFFIHKQEDGWHYQDGNGVLQIPALSLIGDFQRYNAAISLFAVRSLQHRLPISESTQKDALSHVHLMGRFQYLQHDPDVILDVAHNPQAAKSLFDNLNQIKNNGKLIAVFSMLADKDIPSVVNWLYPVIDEWHVAALNHPRGASLPELVDAIKSSHSSAMIFQYDNINEALHYAYKNFDKNDKIIVFGSFYTVAVTLQHWSKIVYE